MRIESYTTNNEANFYGFNLLPYVFFGRESNGTRFINIGIFYVGINITYGGKRNTCLS